MKMYIYGVRDLLTGFVGINLDSNDAVAKRNFVQASQNVGSFIQKNLKDVDLCCLASFDLETGEIVPELPRIVCSGASIGGVDHGKDKVD